MFETLKKLFKLRPQFDPACLGDPFALQVEWKPLVKGGTNFKTHQLVETSFNRLEFKMSGMAIFFCSIFIFIGSVFTIFNLGINYFLNKDNIIAFMLPGLFGLVFIGAGIWMLYRFKRPIVFDFQLGFFWKGTYTSEQIYMMQGNKEVVALSEIYALQIISERVSGKNQHYSYELNLVLKNYQRVNVVDHGGLNQIRIDAQKLSAYLKVPVWDAVNK